MKKFAALNHNDKHNLILTELLNIRTPITIDDLTRHINRNVMLCSPDDIGRTVLNIKDKGHIDEAPPIYGSRKFSISLDGRVLIAKGGYKDDRSFRFYLNEIGFHLGRFPKIVIAFLKKSRKIMWGILTLIGLIVTLP